MATITLDSYLVIDALGSSANCDVPRRVMPFDALNAPAALDGSLVITGPITTSSPPGPAPYETPGLYAPSSFDDWYYRIHIYPVTLSLGNLVGNQQRNVTLWNAYFEPLTLDDFQLIDGSGITVIEPVATPYDVKPLEELTYQFEISTNGSPVINAIARWTFEGTDFDVPITGRRVVLMPFKPNWYGGVDETLENLTTVRASYDNSFEQVMEIRGKGARRILQYQVRLHGNMANLFDNLLYGWTGRVFAQPLWQEETNLSVAAFTGNTSIEVVSTQARTFEPGSLAVIYAGYKSYEIVEVDSVSSTTVTLSRPVESDWPVGTEVFPVMVCQMETMTSTRRASDTHLDAVMRMTSTPSENLPRFDGGTAPLTYRGEEIYLGKTNWVQPLEVPISPLQTQFEANGTGVYRINRKASFPVLQRGYSWIKDNKAEVEELRNMLARRRGRLKNVWLSSGVRDFEMTESAVGSDTSFRVKDTEYGTLIAMHPARRNVLIEMRNGTYIARQITDYQIHSGSGDGIVTIDSELGQPVEPQNVKRISFLGLYRMSADAVTFAWRSVEICNIEVNFTLKQPT